MPQITGTLVLHVLKILSLEPLSASRHHCFWNILLVSHMNSQSTLVATYMHSTLSAPDFNDLCS